MADTPAAKTTAAAPAEQAEQTEFPLTLEEFCSRLSATDRRVELISAFARSEKAERRNKALHSEFAARYDKYIKTPA